MKGAAVKSAHEDRGNPRLKWILSARWLDVVIGVAVTVVMASPVLFTNRAFMIDFTNSMWLGTAMRQSLFHGFPPTFFINTNYFAYSGIFNPIFAFYGGPLFVLLALLTDIFGHNIVAGADALVLLAFATAYGGTAWLSHQCGLKGRLMHVPAVAVVSAAYFLTDLYGRGDLAEFVSLSMIPLIVASAVHLVRARSWTSIATILLIMSVVVFTGSHNISLLWGSLIGAVVLVVLAAVFRPRRLPIKRLGLVALIMTLATMVNGWHQLPDIAFGGTTFVAKGWTSVAVTFLDSPTLLFDPLRAVPSQSGTAALYVQAPVWFLGWSTICGVCIWSRWGTTVLRQWWTALALLLAALFVLIIDTPLWSSMPPTLTLIQFPYRLNGYVLLLSAGLVLVSMLAVQGEMARPKRSRFAPVLIATLVGVAAISMGLAVWQVWVPTSCFPAAEMAKFGAPACAATRSSALTPVDVLPGTWDADNNYDDATQPVVQVAAGRAFVFSPALVAPHGDSLVAIVDPPGGIQPFVTNIMAGPQLLSIGGGIERVGRTETGAVVVRRVDLGDGPIRVVIKTANGPVIVAGRWFSLAGLIGVGLLLAGQIVLRRDRRRRPTREGHAASLQGLGSSGGAGDPGVGSTGG